MAAAAAPAKKRSRNTGLKLDLGCGLRPTEGFQGVDIVEGDGVDFVVDLFHPPWPFEDRSVREVVCNHFVEHIPHYRPEYDGIDGFWVFFNELYRVCRKGAQITIVCPYGKSDRGIWDPSHTRLIHELNFYYLDPKWLEAQGLSHYPTDCNFEVVNIEGTGVPEVIMTRNQEMQDQARAWYWNIVSDLIVKLKVIR